MLYRENLTVVKGKTWSSNDVSDSASSCGLESITFPQRPTEKEKEKKERGNLGKNTQGKHIPLFPL